MKLRIVGQAVYSSIHEIRSFPYSDTYIQGVMRPTRSRDQQRIIMNSDILSHMKVQNIHDQARGHLHLF